MAKSNMLLMQVVQADVARFEVFASCGFMS